MCNFCNENGKPEHFPISFENDSSEVSFSLLSRTFYAAWIFFLNIFYIKLALSLFLSLSLAKYVQVFLQK